MQENKRWTCNVSLRGKSEDTTIIRAFKVKYSCGNFKSYQTKNK